MKNNAAEKIKEELEKFRSDTIKKEKVEIYRMATHIVFAEASAHYTQALLQYEDLEEKIMSKFSSIVECSRYVIRSANHKKMTLGDMKVEDFKNFIIDYYNLDHQEIAEAKRKQAIEDEKRKKEQKAKRKIAAEWRRSKAKPKEEDTQISLFGGALHE